MIRRISSNLSTFKSIDLRPGLNILVSNKGPKAKATQTRNRAGKTSLTETISFVLGSDCNPDSLFRSPDLSQYSFQLDFDLLGDLVSVERSGSSASKIVVKSGKTGRWLKLPRPDKSARALVLSNTNWRAVLGKAFFKLDEEANQAEAADGGGRPTFRSLFSYFVRREADGGMREPTRSNDEQRLGNRQIAMSYLLGLDWSLASEWEAIRAKERQIRELKRIVGQGLIADVLDSAASLRSRLVVTQDKAERLGATLSSFRVHEQYHDLEREATRLTKELSALLDQDSLDLLYVAEVRSALEAEVPPKPKELDALYREAGIILPDLVRKRFNEVVIFHESVIRNRRSYLESELAQAQHRIEEREKSRNGLDQRRSDVMSMLKSHGALDQFIALQVEHGKLQGEAAALRHRFEAATLLESTSVSMNAQRVHLVERLRRDLDEQGKVVDDAIRAFNEVVDQLYEESGQLEFHATNNGLDIRLAIQGDRSRGINNMEIFCFDMMLQKMCIRQGFGPGFLVHDSHLFDGVDPRQVGKALQVGSRIAEQLGFQYLVTLNSDALSEVPSDFNINDYILPVTLTDDTEEGGLFGFRFQPPRPTVKKSRVAVQDEDETDPK